MGKKRLTQLLDQLKANQQTDLQNTAAIYTVAQVAVNELQEATSDVSVLALNPGQSSIDKAELIRRYGSYSNCRQIAKQNGLKFSRNPSWQQLATGFTYLEALQQIVRNYLDKHPDPLLEGITVELKLGSAAGQNKK
ncbi:hypothetical protein [Gloeocapsopsis dulcis]|uniref:Uncharacterized protein n=1 Tax=Gloeocapsopsis dulcis AAB1 = 1H9 TaxID=1433147 RepID=A0A6N8FWG7_9CHRO|nr:hypothetical protein [Gloeocapsopsis dulcis]MUL37209.1 hypothetical protein [Gloeocapsopsis dulcis AAB1 = 1H9]WNN90180.1 hypothetical protein P0S91_03515 [Gloeocapsopsis dulcis]